MTYRIALDGNSPAVAILGDYLHRTPPPIRFEVVERWVQYRVVFQPGGVVCLDSVDSELERRVEANLEELYPGPYEKQRAGGNRDPRAMVVTVPETSAEVVARAVYRALLQVTMRRPWWRRLLS